MNQMFLHELKKVKVRQQACLSLVFVTLIKLNIYMKMNLETDE